MVRRRRPATAVLVVAAVALLPTCSGGEAEADQPGSQLVDAIEANQALLNRPLCEVVDDGHLADLGLSGATAVADANPVWTECRWDGRERSLVVRAGTLTSMNSPSFTSSDAKPTPIDHPSARRAATIDDDPVAGCTTLAVELADDGGFADLAVCGPGAPLLVEQLGEPIAAEVLDHIAG